MQVIIERTIGGYIVSKLSRYETQYTAPYTSYNVARNIYGQRLCDIQPREVAYKTYIQTRYKAGIALSHVMAYDQACQWAKSQGLELYTGRLHTTIKGALL